MIPPNSNRFSWESDTVPTIFGRPYIGLVIVEGQGSSEIVADCGGNLWACEVYQSGVAIYSRWERKVTVPQNQYPILVIQ